MDQRNVTSSEGGGSQNTVQQRREKQRPLAPVDREKFSWDIGISKITKAKKPGRMRLPNSIEIDPSEWRMESRLQQIVDLSTFEGILIEALRPRIKDPKLLLPNVFRAQVSRLMSGIRKEMQAKNTALDPELEGILTHLQEQLRQEEVRNNLLEQYRLMILMG